MIYGLIRIIKVYIFELNEFKRGEIIYFQQKNLYCKTFRQINCHYQLQISTKARFNLKLNLH